MLSRKIGRFIASCTFIQSLQSANPPLRKIMQPVDIVYFDAGSGHRSAAYALARALTMTQPQLRIRPINLLDIFAYDHRVHRITNSGINYFNWCLRREMVFDLKGLTNISLLFHDL